MDLLEDPFIEDQIRVELAHQRTMCAALWSMRQEGMLCDVTLHVEGCTLRVHAAVLSACSPYLKQLCANPPDSDSDQRDLQIENCSLAVCYKMMEYIYTGSYVQFLDSEVDDFEELCKAWRVPNPAKRKQSKAVQRRVKVRAPHRHQAVQCNMAEADTAVTDHIIMDDLGNCVSQPIREISARAKPVKPVRKLSRRLTPVKPEPLPEEDDDDSSPPSLPDNDLDFSDNEDSNDATGHDNNIMNLVEAALADENNAGTEGSGAGRKRKRNTDAGTEDTEKVKCMRCNIVFQTQNLLLAHNVESHWEPGIEQPHQFVCMTVGCMYKTYYDKAFQAHQAYHNEVPTPPVDIRTQCDICGRVYPSAERMKAHRNRMHKPKSLMQSCEFCGRLFRLKHEVRNHIMRVHSEREKFVCTMCGYSCITPEAMDNHKFKHHGEEPSTSNT